MAALFNYQKADDKIFVCKFSEIFRSKLYHIENSKSVDLDEVAHYELFANSAIFVSGT